jgi:hypothetical protein
MFGPTPTILPEGSIIRKKSKPERHRLMAVEGAEQERIDDSLGGFFIELGWAGQG